MRHTLFLPFLWLTLWLIATFILFITINNESQNGYIIKKDCMRDEEDVCLLYSTNYKVELIDELKIQSVGAGILIGGFVIVFGYGREMLKRQS